MPIIIQRKQFLLTLAFALTINKSQGQSFESVGIYLERTFFSHEQLYVAVSRCKNLKNLFIENKVSLEIIIPNIVWKEILNT